MLHTFYHNITYIKFYFNTSCQIEMTEATFSIYSYTLPPQCNSKVGLVLLLALFHFLERMEFSEIFTCLFQKDFLSTRMLKI